MIVLIVAGFMLHSVLHMESSIIALSGAVIMMIIGRQNIEGVVSDVEWPTIIFFTALFIVVGGMVETGVIDRKLADLIMGVTGGKPVMTMMIILSVSALLVPTTLDNIPFVATMMIPLITAMGNDGMDVMPLWWALSLGACLGGNGTLIGRFCKCSTDWYQCQERSSGYIHAVPEDRIPDDDPAPSAESARSAC